jgi:hypothetical protein
MEAILSLPKYRRSLAVIAGGYRNIQNFDGAVIVEISNRDRNWNPSLQVNMKAHYFLI